MHLRQPVFAKIAGPGILFACTAVGVSHLIQSTRAGAEFGLMMLAFVVLAMVLKYPFFEFGARYANSTRTSIIDGYTKIGRPVLWMYLALTVSTMFFVTGAVGLVTAGFFEDLFGVDLGPLTIILLLGSCVAILASGRYGVLDGLIKVVAIVLLVSTALAFALAIQNGPVEPAEGFAPSELWNAAGVFFLLALMGWMPAPIDISAWSSIWTLERFKQTGYIPKLKETVFEFRVAYMITGALAVMFVVLGAFIFYGSGEELPASSSGFAHKVVELYTHTIGPWSHVLIAASAFSVMFGTVIALFDGYARSLQRSLELVARRDLAGPKAKAFYVSAITALAAGGMVVIFQFGGNLRELVDFATVLSFVVAPVLAVFNYKLVSGRHIAAEHRPSAPLKALSVAGIAFLGGFAALFVASRLVDLPYL